MGRKAESDNLLGEAAFIGNHLKICVNLCNLRIKPPFSDSKFGVSNV